MACQGIFPDEGGMAGTVPMACHAPIPSVAFGCHPPISMGGEFLPTDYEFHVLSHAYAPNHRPFVSYSSLSSDKGP